MHARFHNARVAVLTSGGVDSNILLAEILKDRRYEEVFPLYIRAGVNWEAAELHWLRKYLKALRRTKLRPLSVLKMPIDDVISGWAITGRAAPARFFSGHELNIRGRNLLILSKALTFCAQKEIPALAVGTLKDNPFPDASPEFFRRFGRLATEALDYPVRILAPFRRMKKKEIVKKANGLPIQLSFSCLAPKGIKACRRCLKCLERARVL
jgi:7-cyano-7-deazaguanine synthase